MGTAKIKHITIGGNKSDVYKAQKVLGDIDLGFSPFEGERRLKIQKVLDENNLKADVMYNGNPVWSYERLVRDFKKALKSKPCKITEYGSGDYTISNYLYEFFIFACGSIAHYNKYGWIGSYPRKTDLKKFIVDNETGHRIDDYQPDWQLDAIKIAKKFVSIVNGGENNNG